MYIEKNIPAALHPLSLNINTLRPRQNGRHFADDTFKRIFMNENVRILIKISLKFVPKGPINNIHALVQIMAWRRPGDKPLSEPMLVSLLTHICVTRPQWVKSPIHSEKVYFMVMIASCSWCDHPILPGHNASAGYNLAMYLPVIANYLGQLLMEDLTPTINPWISINYLHRYSTKHLK